MYQIIVLFKDSKQEIIENEKNGLILGEDYGLEAKRILRILNDKTKLKEIIQSSIDKIKGFSLESWENQYLGVLLK